MWCLRVRLAAVSEQIADLELQILRQQVRIENWRAQGRDAAALASVLRTMQDTLAVLRAHYEQLEGHAPREHAQPT